MLRSHLCFEATFGCKLEDDPKDKVNLIKVFSLTYPNLNITYFTAQCIHCALSLLTESNGFCARFAWVLITLKSLQFNKNKSQTYVCTHVPVNTRNRGVT